jgi:DNA-directed RNA polymerase subunit RPC12/RpoP
MKISFVDTKDKFLPYGELGNQGLKLIEAVNSNKVKRILQFGDLEAKEKDILIYIKDFNNLPDYFLALKENKRIKTCDECGKIFIDNSKNNLQRKCQDCKKKKKTKKTERKFCVDCDKEIIIRYNNQASQIRCKECQKKIEHQKKTEKYQQIAMKTKTIICEDCKKEIIVPSTFRRNRCDECYVLYRKQKINENAKKYYKEKQK